MPTYVYECSECCHRYERRHSVHEEPDKRCPECLEFAIKRIIQVPQISPSSLPSRMNKIPPRKADPAWERGIAGEHRRDGSFVPYLGSNGKQIGVKEFADNRSKYEGLLREREQKKTSA